MAHSTTRLLSAGSVAALLATAGCAHDLVAPAFKKSVYAGGTMLLLPAQVTVRAGTFDEVDKVASEAASAHVTDALQRYLEQERGLRVVRLGAAPEEARRAGELHLRVATVLPKLRERMTGSFSRGDPGGITIHSIEEELAAAGADALVVIEGSDHVSDLAEVVAHVFTDRPAGASELELVIVAPSGEIVYFDGLREEGTYFLARAEDAHAFVWALADDLPK